MRTTPHAQFVTVDDGIRALQAFRVNELEIVRADAAMLCNPDGARIGPIPLVLVKPRPDITDLARVHKAEGEGRSIYEWRFGLHPDVTGPSWAVLRVKLITPVRCTFSLAFHLHTHRRFLLALADLSAASLITYPEQPPTEALGLVGIPIADLRPVLAAHALATDLIAVLGRKRGRP